LVWASRPDWMPKNPTKTKLSFEAPQISLIKLHLGCPTTEVYFSWFAFVRII